MNPERAPLSAIQLAVTSAALDGDGAAIYHMLIDLLGQGMPFDVVLFDVLAPVQVALGERWHGGDYLISDEHAATNAVETVVGLLAGSFERPASGRRVVVACVEGDNHSLPGRMLTALLLYRGLPTTHLGITLPADDLELYLATEAPDVLVLTCSMTSHLAGALESIAAGHRAGVPVMVGGRAFGPEGIWAERLGADVWAPTLREAADMLESWDHVPAPTGTASGQSSEMSSLKSARPAIIGNAASAAAGSPLLSARYVEDLELLYDGLLATLAVSETQIIQEIAKWLDARSDAGRDAGRAAGLLAALQTAAGEEHPEAARRLRAATAGLGGE